MWQGDRNDPISNPVSWAGSSTWHRALGMALRGARRVGATRTRAGPMPARRATAVARETDTARSEDLATTTGRGVLEEKRQVLARTEAATAPVFDGTLRFHVRPAENLSEVYQVASLRAECYYEDRPFTRFVSNFKNEYARAEFRRLKAQSAATCLVCVDLENSSGDGNVIGSIDVTELALVKSKVHVPGREELVAGQEDSAFNSYVSNFCIRKGEFFSCNR